MLPFSLGSRIPIGAMLWKDLIITEIYSETMADEKELPMANLTVEAKSFGGKVFHEIDNLPKGLVGSTYFLDYSEDHNREGPFSILFILCTEFIMYFDDLAERNIDPSKGFSNIIFPKDFTGKVISIPYQFEDTTSGEPEALIRPIVEDNLLRSMEVTLFEQDFDRAIRAASYCVSTVLDSLAFRLKVPLNFRDIVVYSFKTGELIGRFITIPYFPTSIEGKDDFYVTRDMPKELRPYLTIYREALNSTSPHYRFLCLYRIIESLRELESINAKKIKSQGGSIERSRLIMPSNPITQKYFSTYVGKKIGSFLRYIEHTYRNHIAHLSIEAPGNMMLNPVFVKTEHDIVFINTVLLQIVQEMIEDEWKFMRDNKL